jgi:hypothetical protein
MARMLDFAPFFNLLRSAVAIYLKYLNVLKALFVIVLKCSW